MRNSKNKTINQIKALAMVVVMLVATVFAGLEPVTVVYAEDGLTLKLHYHREDEEYGAWDVWLWPEGGDGAGYPFEEEDGEMVATMEVAPGVSSVGFIVRTQDWAKDIDQDQFIDLSAMVSGTIHVYVESGVEGYTEQYAEDAVTGTKLKSAVYDGDSVVILTLTGEMSPEQEASVHLFDQQGEVEIATIEQIEGYQYALKPVEALNAYRSYQLAFEGKEYTVSMPNVYSTEEFESQFTYTGNDLGAVYSAAKTSFRVWAPTAETVYLNRYESGDYKNEDLIEQIVMKPDVNGTWVAEVSGDIEGTYYTYTAVIDGEEREACDPYARTTGVNGQRAMVIDLAKTNPEGWEKDQNPHAGEQINDAIIYELHIRDFSADESSGMVNAGKYLAFTETGTKNASGASTGVDYLRELGITHVHLLPFYDYGSVNEKSDLQRQYNWGYDPVNYNVPEGSYSTDPTRGEVRVLEAKQMIKSLHDNGISVVMDVVYNHVYSGEDFCFNRLVPGYFSRINDNGSYSNGSGCGNDTASERSMVHKYIVDSVCYLAEEYHIDGFRFDLVGLLDVDTINEIVEKVHETHPDVIFYGEGWSLSTTLTKDGYQLATQANSALTPGFAYFNDNIRDSLKGSVFDTGTGYVSGATDQKSAVASSFLGRESWSQNPLQIINYASCHDNMTLFDRLSVSRPDASREDLIRMNNLTAAIYMTAQGVPFLQAGEELLRSKVRSDGTFDSNSYNSGDVVNSIKWDTLEEEATAEVLAYYQGLIAFRKAHGSLHLTTSEDVLERIMVVNGLDNNVLAFVIDGDEIEEETASKMVLIFNPNTEETTVALPEGEWNVYVNENRAGTEVLETLTEGSATVAPISAMILVQEDQASQTISPQANKTMPIVVSVIIGVIVVAGGAILLTTKKKNK